MAQAEASSTHGWALPAIVLPLVRVCGAAADWVIVESVPMLTVNVAVTMLPPVDERRTSKVVSPCRFAARVSTGSTVKVQPLRLTETMREVSILTAFPQDTT